MRRPGDHGRLHDQVGWALLVVIVAAVVVALVANNRGDTDDDRRTGTSAPTPSAAPAAPEGTPDIGMYVASEVTRTGDVEVQHWIRADRPLTSLQLTTADPDGLPGGLPGGVVARNVVVIGDGQVLARRLQIGSTQQTLELKEPAAELYLTYTLTGGVETDDGTVAGRVLARSVAVDVDHDREAGPVTRQVSGPGVVLNVACVRRDDTDRTPRPCGRASGDGWVVELRGRARDDRLMVQLDNA